MSSKKRNLDDLDGYNSDFEDEDVEERRESRARRHDLTEITIPGSSTTQTHHRHHSAALPTKEYFENERTRADSFKNSYGSLNAFERHRKLINEYFLYFPGASKLLKRDGSKDKTDRDIIQENHRFIWDDTDEADTWGKQLSKKYYDKLFKEYCICDLSCYKLGKFAMRWRTEKEVIDGKGQFLCGAKKCNVGQELRSWEVNFAYMEESVKKNALVKLRLCPGCSLKLNYHHKNKEVTKPKKKKRRRERQTKIIGSGSSTSSNTMDHLVDDDKHKPTEEKERGDASIWKEPVPLPDVKSRDEEFEDYFGDLFQ